MSKDFRGANTNNRYKYTCTGQSSQVSLARPLNKMREMDVFITPAPRNGYSRILSSVILF